MHLDSIMALMRISGHSDGIVANLARTILALVERLREYETRATLAEMALEAERAKVAELKAAIERLGRPSKLLGA